MDNTAPTLLEYKLSFSNAEGKQLETGSISVDDWVEFGGYFHLVTDGEFDRAFIAELVDVALSFDAETDNPTDEKKLTLEKVIELSDKGEELTWSDFEQYDREDIGSGMYIYRYEIDENNHLLIGGQAFTSLIIYILLVSNADQDTAIDIRTEDVRGFIEQQSGLRDQEQKRLSYYSTR